MTVILRQRREGAGDRGHDRDNEMLVTKRSREVVKCQKALEGKNSLFTPCKSVFKASS